MIRVFHDGIDSLGVTNLVDINLDALICAGGCADGGSPALRELPQL